MSLSLDIIVAQAKASPRATITIFITRQYISPGLERELACQTVDVQNPDKATDWRAVCDVESGTVACG